MSKYEILKDTPEQLTILDKDSEYQLNILNYHSMIGDIYFSIPSLCKFDFGTTMPVTARKFKDYPKHLRELAKDFDKNHQYLEIGAGYSEFLQELVLRGLRKKPIIIDPVNFEYTKGLLDFVKESRSDPKQLAKVGRLLKPRQFLTNLSEIKLYNCTLGEALKKYYYELSDVADVVIDNCAAQVYAETEAEFQKDLILGKDPLIRKVINLERQLLNSSGKLCSCH